MSTPERRYLAIGEVLGLLRDEFPDVTISKIRFLESQGLIDPERTPSGYRKFYPTDVERLRFILREQKEHFLPLRVIRDRLEEAMPGTAPSGAAPDPADAPAELAEIDADATGERLPVWMTAPPPKPRNPLLVGGVEASGASYSAAELAEAAGLTVAQVAEAQQFGLLGGRTTGKETYFGPEAVGVAKVVAGFLRSGIGPRHLRTYKNACDREVSLYEQVILPLVKQRNPHAQTQAAERLGALAELGSELRAALLRQALRQYLD